MTQYNHRYIYAKSAALLDEAKNQLALACHQNNNLAYVEILETLKKQIQLEIDAIKDEK